jgi:hypothetical protein
MDRTPVVSSMIGSIGYDPSSGTLEIEFRKGGPIWQYYDVPEYMWHEFESAESLGKYFLANIKNHFREARVG